MGSLLSEILKLFLTVPTNTALYERNCSCLRFNKAKQLLEINYRSKKLPNITMWQIERNQVIGSEITIDELNAAATINGRP